MFLILVILGFLPSLFWLSYYLKKDIHPEPKRMIVRIFFLGMLIAPVAAVAEMLYARFSGPAAAVAAILYAKFSREILCRFAFPQCGENIPAFFFQLMILIIGIAAIEEFAKYYVVRKKAIPTGEFDEPLDAMVYLIVSALGFAALENIFILIAPTLANFIQGISQLFLELFGGINAKPISTPLIPLGSALSIIGFRFFGATFLHALASAIVGYFLALSYFRPKHHATPLLIAGLALATLLHAFYNYFIITLDTESLVYIPEGMFIKEIMIAFGPVIVLITLMALLVSMLFRRLRILKSS